MQVTIRNKTRYGKGLGLVYGKDMTLGSDLLDSASKGKGHQRTRRNKGEEKEGEAEQWCSSMASGHKLRIPPDTVSV